MSDGPKISPKHLLTVQFHIDTLVARRSQGNNTQSIVSTSSPVLSWKVDFRVDNAHVTGERIASRKGLFLDTECATHLLLARIVDGILVTRQIIRPRENGVTGFSSGRVDSFALMRACLRISRKDSR